MNAWGGCLSSHGVKPSGKDMEAMRFTAVKAFAVALLAGIGLAAGAPAVAASFPVFSLTGGAQIADPAPYSVSTDGLNYVAKTVTIQNQGTNNINRVQLTISASTKVPVKDFSDCVAPCTSVTPSADGTSVQYFFDVFPPSASVSVIVSFSTPISSGSMNVLGAVRINNTNNNSSQLVASLTSPINLGGDAADVLGYLPKNGGQVTALKKGVLKTTVTFPSNLIANPVGSVTQEIDPSSCSALYNVCVNSAVHLPATGDPATFGNVLQMVLDLDAAALSGSNAKIENAVLQYQKQVWNGTAFVASGDPLPIQPCNTDGSIPPDATGYASGRCQLPPQDLTFKKKGVLQGFWRFFVNSYDNGLLLFR
jgi:hypothetical protein